MSKYLISDLALRIAKKKIQVDIFGTNFYLPSSLIIGVGIMIMGIYSLRYALAYGKWITTIHPVYNYSIIYPATWSMSQYNERGSGKGSDYVRQDFGRLGTSVLIYEIPVEKPTYAKAIEWSQEIISRQRVFDSTELQNTFVGYANYPAQIRIDSSHDLLGRTMKTKNVFILSDNHIFLLQFETPERNFGEASLIFDEMLASFHLLEE